MPPSRPPFSAESPGKRGGGTGGGERGEGGEKRPGVSLGWAEKAVKRGEKETEEGGRGGRRAKVHLSPAPQGGRGKGAPRRALNADRRVAGPGRGTSAEARGVSAGSAVPACGSAALRLREAPGFPSAAGSRGKRRPRAPPAPAQPGRLGSQRSGRAPPGRGRRAQSWAAGTVTSARRILCCAPLRSGGSPGPAAPGPAASIRPQPPAQREIKPPPIPLHAFGETFPAAAGRWDFGEGARRRTPQPLPAPGRVPGSDVKASPPPPPRLPPPPSATPAPPSEVTETFSCSGKGEEPLPAEGGGVRGGSRGAEAAAAGH